MARQLTEVVELKIDLPLIVFFFEKIAMKFVKSLRFFWLKNAFLNH